MKFVPAAPGFKILWIDREGGVTKTAPLVGWVTNDDPLDIEPAYWEFGAGISLANWSEREGEVDVVREEV
jgi:hypothetical protein